MRNLIRFYPIAIAQILLLCACSMTPPSDRSDSLSQQEDSGQASSDSGDKPTADKGFNVRHDITPTQSIEKDGLLISYSLVAVPDKEGLLIRLSLVFRNMQGQSMTVRPKVSLQDVEGKVISAYSKTGFIRFSSRLAKKASDDVTISLIKDDSSGKIFAKSRTKWADTFWLKNSYKIPSQGIAIGELVYHSTHLDLPLKLTVNSNDQEFVFTTKGSLKIIDR